MIHFISLAVSRRHNMAQARLARNEIECTGFVRLPPSAGSTISEPQSPQSKPAKIPLLQHPMI
jgi:hypothetical protein